MVRRIEVSGKGTIQISSQSFIMIQYLSGLFLLWKIHNTGKKIDPSSNSVHWLNAEKSLQYNTG